MSDREDQGSPSSPGGAVWPFSDGSPNRTYGPRPIIAPTMRHSATDRLSGLVNGRSRCFLLFLQENNSGD